MSIVHFCFVIICYFWAPGSDPHQSKICLEMYFLRWEMVDASGYKKLFLWKIKKQIYYFRLSPKAFSSLSYTFLAPRKCKARLDLRLYLPTLHFKNAIKSRFSDLSRIYCLRERAAKRALYTGRAFSFYLIVQFFYKKCGQFCLIHTCAIHIFHHFLAL